MKQSVKIYSSSKEFNIISIFSCNMKSTITNFFKPLFEQCTVLSCYIHNHWCFSCLWEEGTRLCNRKKPIITVYITVSYTLPTASSICLHYLQKSSRKASMKHIKLLWKYIVLMSDISINVSYCCTTEQRFKSRCWKVPQPSTLTLICVNIKQCCGSWQWGHKVLFSSLSW